MPFYVVAEPIARIFIEQGWGVRALTVLIMYMGLGLLSELLHKLVDINKIKSMRWQPITTMQR
jgi:hypothetical protein